MSELYGIDREKGLQNISYTINRWYYNSNEEDVVDINLDDLIKDLKTSGDSVIGIFYVNKDNKAPLPSTSVGSDCQLHFIKEPVSSPIKISVRFINLGSSYASSSISYYWELKSTTNLEEDDKTHIRLNNFLLNIPFLLTFTLYDEN